MEHSLRENQDDSCVRTKGEGQECTWDRERNPGRCGRRTVARKGGGDVGADHRIGARARGTTALPDSQREPWRDALGAADGRGPSGTREYKHGCHRGLAAEAGDGGRLSSGVS